MKGRPLVWIVILPLFIFTALGTSLATQVERGLEIHELSLRAAKVVEAKCISVREDPGSPNLVYTFKVTRTLKGRKRASTVEIRIPGGHLGKYNLYVPGITSAAPKVGDQVLLFLGRSQNGLFPLGYWKGIKRIRLDNQGNPAVEIEHGRWEPLSTVREAVLRAVNGDEGR